MQLGFLPFISHQVTEQSTVYKAMENFIDVPNQLEQDDLPLFADEGVFRKVNSIPGSFSYHEVYPTLHRQIY